MTEPLGFSVLPQALRAGYAELLTACGLRDEGDSEWTVVLPGEDDTILACGSLSGKILKQLAVRPEASGGGACAAVVTALLQEALRRGVAHPFLYTKPANVRMFRSMGFYPIAQTAEMCMMERRRDGLTRYLAAIPPAPEAAAVVCNCNPFTLGHLHLIETAAAENPAVYVFVLSEENGGMFSAADRLSLVRAGTAQLPNVTVVPGGDYLISRGSFPAYFLKGDPEEARCDLDLTLFGQRIAPALHIRRRYVGSEPFSPLTERYNARMKLLLPPLGVEVRELPRYRDISASRVRECIRAGCIDQTRAMVPETTYAFLKNHFGADAPCP